MAAAAGAQVITFGVLYTFGVVLNSAKRDLGTGTSTIALVPAVAALTLFLAGPFTGRQSDARGAHWMVGIATLLLPAGLLVTSVAPSVWIAAVGFGLMGGLAASCVYVPAVTHVVSMPSRHAPLYAGIVVAGVGVGPALLAPVVSAMVEAAGWRVAYRLYASGALVGLAVVWGVLSRARRGSPAGRRASTLGTTLARLWRTGRFVQLYVAIAAVSPSLYVGLLFLPSYATDQGLSSGTGAALVATLALASAVGRIALTVLAQRAHPLTVFRMCFGLLAASLLIWLVADGQELVLFVSAVIGGTGYGGLLGLAPSITAAEHGSTDLGATLGVLYTAIGLGGLVGGPGVGAVIDRAGYAPALAALAVLACAGAALVPGSRGRVPQPPSG